MSLFGAAAVGGAATGYLNKAATKATVWTTCWPVWDEFAENAHKNEPEVGIAVPMIWLRHDRSLGASLDCGSGGVRT